MQNVVVYIVNEKGFAPINKDNFLSFEKLGVGTLLPDFITKRLNFFGYKNIKFIEESINSQIINAETTNYEFAVIINLKNPFIDAKLLDKMILLLQKSTDYDMCTSEGAIPGTEPDSVVRVAACGDKQVSELNKLTIMHDTQSRYNSQLNLRKFKRIKIFKYLAESIKNIEQLEIDELMTLFASKEVFEKIISYCEDVSLTYLSECPYCNSAIEPLRATVSQPMIGFIPDSKAYYYQCSNCKLVVLSPTIASEDTAKLYDIYTQEGQEQSYYLQQKRRYRCYELATKMISDLVPKELSGIDLASGSGTFIYYLKEYYPLWNVMASDLPQTLQYFKYPEGIKTKALNFSKENIGDNEYDLISSWEAIEHMPFSAFEEYLNKIYAALKPNGVFVFSTPNFESPFGQAWDLWNVCAPHHLLVFTKSWFDNFFAKDSRFELVGFETESEMLTEYESWFKYFAQTSKNFESKAQATIFLEMLRDETMSNNFKELLSKKKWGMEMIVAVRKKNPEFAH